MTNPVLAGYRPLWWAGILMVGMAAVAPAAMVKSAHSGAWSNPKTWVGDRVPGDDDSVNISNGHTVTVNDARTIGPSPAKVVIELNASGKLVIAAGGTLVVRGDTTYAPGDNKTEALVIEGGGTWKFDSSKAPQGTRYRFYPNGEAGFRPVHLMGTKTARAVLTSAPGGMHGSFEPPEGKGPGGAFLSVYGEISRIGDATTPAIVIRYEYSGAHRVFWNVTHTRFINCGAIVSGNDKGVDDGGTFVHSYNVHEKTASPEIFSKWLNIIDGSEKTTREIHSNIFDTSFTRTAFYPNRFTIWNNYFGDATVTGGYWKWKSWRGNFVRYTDWWPVNSSGLSVMGELEESYLFVDSDWGNPKPLVGVRNIQANLKNIIFGQAGTGKGPPGAQDSGELWWNVSPEKDTVYGIIGSIILPNMNGYGSLELGAWAHFPNLQAMAEHNTWFGGYPGSGKDAVNGDMGFPAVQVGEGFNPPPGTIKSLKSNIFWNPQLPGYTAGFSKLADIGEGYKNPNGTTDVCAPADCDYNAGWGHTVIAPMAKDKYIHQGKGYLARFSKTPGAHDVDVDPKFLDYQRSVELFDSKYLDHHPTNWDTAKTYKEGDFVSWSRRDIYWGQPVNYRYAPTAACAAKNPEPGHGDHWRDCWEWASLFRMREAMVQGKTFDDQTIGVHGDSVIVTVMAWVRSGYAPTNPALAGAAHDKGDIGAVPVSFPPAKPAVTR